MQKQDSDKDTLRSVCGW